MSKFFMSYLIQAKRKHMEKSAHIVFNDIPWCDYNSVATEWRVVYQPFHTIQQSFLKESTVHDSQTGVS